MKVYCGADKKVMGDHPMMDKGLVRNTQGRLWRWFYCLNHERAVAVEFSEDEERALNLKPDR